ncbi:hypothetical protein PARMER_02455 [Parabacteroides merdae ATCC 43184]|nr:hypothetical protein PARMER_02455 [Parabacteroides merdae ATCC 43184]
MLFSFTDKKKNKKRRSHTLINAYLYKQINVNYAF